MVSRTRLPIPMREADHASATARKMASRMPNHAMSDLPQFCAQTPQSLRALAPLAGASFHPPHVFLTGKWPNACRKSRSFRWPLVEPLRLGELQKVHGVLRTNLFPYGLHRSCFFGTFEKNVCPRLFDAATIALVFVFGSVRVVKVADREPCTLQSFSTCILTQKEREHTSTHMPLFSRAWFCAH